MKEIPQRHLPEISGGDHNPNTPEPSPTEDPLYPQNPFGPLYDAPLDVQE
jgi:hypothetical protein